VQRWLEPPYALDGWRIDVAHLTGRRHEVDVLVEISQGIRTAAISARPDAVIVAEHGHDARADLRAGGWHGTMNYPGFTRPVWSWLRADVLPSVPAQEFVELPVGVPLLPGEHVAEGMQRFRAGVPWNSVLHSWVILDSHDTARFKTIAGSRERQLVGMGLQMTSPGVPMVFAGDEIGLEGAWGEDSRRTMPWGHPGSWDKDVLAAYRRLISLRRSSSALARGGIRYVHVSSDAIAYLRESADERVLCLARRRSGEPLRLAGDALGGKPLEVLASEGWTGELRTESEVVILPGEGPAFHAWRIE
jgi:alpha-glucosidase